MRKYVASAVRVEGDRVRRGGAFDPFRRKGYICVYRRIKVVGRAAKIPAREHIALFLGCFGLDGFLALFDLLGGNPAVERDGVINRFGRLDFIPRRVKGYIRGHRFREVVRRSVGEYPLFERIAVFYGVGGFLRGLAAFDLCRHIFVCAVHKPDGVNLGLFSPRRVKGDIRGHRFREVVSRSVGEYPLLELVAALYGVGGFLRGFAAFDLCRLVLVCAVHKSDRIVDGHGGDLSPFRAEGEILFHRLCEVVFRFAVEPAVEGVALARGVGGFLRGLALLDSLGRHFATAAAVERDGVIYRFRARRTVARGQHRQRHSQADDDGEYQPSEFDFSHLFLQNLKISAIEYYHKLFFVSITILK